MRKHRDLIIAWANGTDIQYRYHDCWIDIFGKPNWDEDIEYRVKPKENVVLIDIRCDEACTDDWDFRNSYYPDFKPNIKVTFGEDNRPIKVELING